MQAASGERDKEYDDRERSGDEPALRRGASGGAGRGARLRRRPRRRARRPTRRSQHPRCVFQILKRHFARYTAEMVEQACGIPRDSLRPGLRADHGQLRPGADHRVRVQRGLDPAHRRRPVHPGGVHPAGAARQHRPARRRHPGAARARLDPGLDRHPDAVRPAARVHPDAARAHQREPRRVHRRGRRPTRGSGRTCAPTRSACSRPGGATPRPRRTTSASTTCPGSPAATAPTRP